MSSPHFGMSGSNFAARSRRKVKILHIGAGADSDLLSHPKQFRDLTAVDLADRSNDSYLKGLASNYPGIRALSIYQLNPLTVGGIRSLKHFRMLEELEINCPIADPTLLSQSFPPHLKTLSVSGPYILTELPHLQRLALGFPATPAYLRSLRIPRLEELQLSSFIMEPEIIQSLRKFNKLKVITASETNLNEQEMTELRRFTSARFVNANPSHNPQPLPAPLR